jgi:ribose transport system substrate-binding protein
MESDQSVQQIVRLGTKQGGKLMKKHIRKLLPATAMLLAGSVAAQASDDLLSSLPDDLKAEYENTTSKVEPVDLSNFTAPDGPYKWCHSESYQGNPWRVALTNEIKRLVDGLIEDGIVSSFEMSDSNGDVSLQISHIRSFIDKDCGIITSVPGSATGLNAAVEAAAEAGIPFVTGAAAVTSPAAINVDSNYYKWGYDMAKNLAEKLDGKGSVLMIEGIAGVSIVDQQRAGAQAAFEEYPEIKVVRMVNGDWTPSVTKSVVLQTLATNPAPIDGVWTTGSETRVVADAFRQAGRPLPVVTGSVSGDALGFWKENPEDYVFTGGALLPSWIGQTMFRAASRIMDGQEPIASTLMIPIPAVSSEDFDGWYAECMKPDSAEIFPVAPTDPVPESVMNAYFSGDTAAPGWDYSEVEPACK